MICWYCSQIAEADSAYPATRAAFDIASETPRCARHWRYACELCLRSWHYHGVSFCPQAQAPFCRRCALDQRRIDEAFWIWSYYWSRRCPFCAEWHPSLDFAEFRGLRLPRRGRSTERDLHRASAGPGFARCSEALDDTAVGNLWDQNADAWAERLGPAGDLSRVVSDPVLFGLLGEVDGQRVLDAGCGEGYLCRMLQERGASVWGVENSRRLVERAQERTEQPDIRYLHGSISAMGEVPTGSMDAVVCNNVLMYCHDAGSALQEFGRILKRSGRAVIVLTHPCFWGPGTDWVRHPPDSVREEEWLDRRVGGYFDPRAGRFVAPGYAAPLVYFPRTLTELFRLFSAAGFQVTHLEEPTLPSSGTSAVPPGFDHRVRALPISLALRLVPGS
ncbi:MAG: methyltransferase domain-containing protein [Armatimonadetes bacterium]|nr:methyltransferase domain-containing protein [Armatimonadota bacterium]